MKSQLLADSTYSGHPLGSYYGEPAIVTLPREVTKRTKKTFAVIRNHNETNGQIAARSSDSEFIQLIDASYPSEVSDKVHLVLEFLEYKLSKDSNYNLSILTKVSPAKLHESVANSFLFYTKRCTSHMQQIHRKRLAARIKVFLRRNRLTDRLPRLEKML